MKILRYLLLFLGILLILVNTFALTVGFPGFYRELSAIKDAPEKVGYFIGSVLLFFIGGLSLMISSHINRKLKRKKLTHELLTSLPE